MKSNFGRLQVSGPDGVTLIGPTEHKVPCGLEGRYSWLLKPRKSRFKISESEALCIRIEKRSGIGIEHDFISPIISLTFVESEHRGKNLEIEFLDSHSIPGHVSLINVGLLNPYLNRFQAGFPQVHIPIEALTGGEYEVSYETDYRGDFLLLTSATQRISINLWSIASLGGLSRVAFGKEGTSASFFLGQRNIQEKSFKAFKKIGHVPMGYELHPFFEIVYGSDLCNETPTDYRFRLVSFSWILELLADHGGDPVKPMLFEKFAICSSRYYDDRQADYAAVQADCIREFGELLQKLFARVS